ncbi:peptidase S41 [Algimonas ampicilliniresistens]|uniref:Peptidase S41 n=1 Tax=Algimonas ampicilliniresistens TaxID=1298735 RepID=A0ABQ5V6H6_9PROT|nr:S41 family peptidase [Algimonas ampicilliniresistens]GLQ23146.1 peptidase S41 [Algimonas ampicilliniresistens]
MKYVLPVVGTVAALGLFAFSTANQAAMAVEKPSYSDTFEQLDLFADVMARVRSDYVVEVEDGQLIEDAINGMLQSLDPHSSYVNPEDWLRLQEQTSGRYVGVGMEVTQEEGYVKVVSPIDGTPAKEAGIESGDYITEINGETVLGLSLTEAVNKIRGKAGESVTITIARADEEPSEITLIRREVNREVVTYEIKDGVPYIRISQFNEKAAPGLEGAITELRRQIGGELPGLVLDVRTNPGGLLDQSIKVSSAFLDGGEVVSTRGRDGANLESYDAAPGQLLRDVPVIVLIDEASASASEIVAGAIQDRGRGLVLGMTSFGKGSVQSLIPLRGGRDGALRLTTQRYYTPAGRSIQGTGIDPDLYVSSIPDDGEDHDRLSESDLPNSIENEDSEAAEDLDTEETVIDFPPEDFDVQDDYQLQRAVELIKSGRYTQRLAELQN